MENKKPAEPQWEGLSAMETMGEAIKMFLDAVFRQLTPY